MFKKLLILSVIFSGCSNPLALPDPRSFHGVDPAFSEQVALFQTLYGAGIGDISIGFEKLEYPRVGVCLKWGGGFRQIKIDPDYWNRTEPRSRIGLILHELGHCKLDREHVDTLKYYRGEHVYGQVPISLMYPYNFYSDSYSDLENYYYRELFTPVISGNFVQTKMHDFVEIIEYAN